MSADADLAALRYSASLGGRDLVTGNGGVRRTPGVQPSGKVEPVAAWSFICELELISATQAIDLEEDLVPGKFGAGMHEIVKEAAWRLGDDFDNSLCD